MIITLQGSLELNGVRYEPGDEVDVPEELYDRLVDSYLIDRTPEPESVPFFDVFK